MASRAVHAAGILERSERQKHLDALGILPLPLPTDPRSAPPAYSPELAEEAVSLGRCGLSITEIADHWSIDTATLDAWGDAHSELAAALSRARTGSEAWWEEKARRAIVLDNNRFPAGVWAMIMRARFPSYRERVEINHHVDLVHRLVLVDRRPNEPGLLQEQAVDESNPLIEGRLIGPSTSPTGEGDMETDALAVVDHPLPATAATHGRRSKAPGVGGKSRRPPTPGASRKTP